MLSILHCSFPDILSSLGSGKIGGNVICLGDDDVSSLHIISNERSPSYDWLIFTSEVYQGTQTMEKASL